MSLFPFIIWGEVGDFLQRENNEMSGDFAIFMAFFIQKMLQNLLLCKMTEKYS